MKNPYNYGFKSLIFIVIALLAVSILLRAINTSRYKSMKEHSLNKIDSLNVRYNTIFNDFTKAMTELQVENDSLRNELTKLKDETPNN